MMAQQEQLTEGWFTPMAMPRKSAHYLQNNRWLCGTQNLVPAIGIRGLFVNRNYPHCKKCEKKLQEQQKIRTLTPQIILDTFNEEHNKVRKEWKKQLYDLEQKNFPTEDEKRQISKLDGMLDGIQMLIHRTNKALEAQGYIIPTEIRAGNEIKVIN